MKLLKSLTCGFALACSVGTLSADEAVNRHLAAGELAAAERVAAAITNPTDRDAALADVAVARARLGFGNAAISTSRRIADRTLEHTTESDARRQAEMAGGSQADFGPIIELIESQTGGQTWSSLGGEGEITQFDQGIRVNPTGMLAKVSELDKGKLAELSATVRTASLNDDMATPSALRMISLTRLEQEVAGYIERGEQIPATLQNLGGLTRVENIFSYPETGELVIAGPGEAWGYDAEGRAIGMESGRPTLQLDDLVTVLRTFGPEGEGVFGCSIDARQENVAAVQQFLATQQGPLRPSAVNRWVKQIDQKLGEADIRVYGVPADSRVAQVLVEADYKMKLIGLDLLDAGSDVPSYFDLLSQNREFINGGVESLRWWLTMKYDAVRHSADRDAFEIAGPGVLCQSENQYLTAEGQQASTGQAEPVNQMFASNFTENYAELSQIDDVFADLQGVLDLALASALIQTESLDAQTNWDRGCFAANGAYQPAGFTPAVEADAVAHHRVYNGRDIVVQAAGGVSADIMSVVRNDSIRSENPRLDTIADNAVAADATNGRWWWDAK